MKSKMCWCTVKTKSTKLILGLSREDWGFSEIFTETIWLESAEVKIHMKKQPRSRTQQMRCGKSLEPDLVGKHRGLGEKRGRELIGGQDFTVQKKFLDLGSLRRGDPWIREWDLGGFTGQWRTEKVGRGKECMGEGPPRHHRGVQPFCGGDW